MLARELILEGPTLPVLRDACINERFKIHSHLIGTHRVALSSACFPSGDTTVFHQVSGTMPGVVTPVCRIPPAVHAVPKPQWIVGRICRAGYFALPARLEGD